MDAIDGTEIAALLIHLSLCGNCIGCKVGAPRGQVDYALERRAKQVTIATIVAQCDACLKLTVVHRLG